jgi:hypothetical protein
MLFMDALCFTRGKRTWWWWWCREILVLAKFDKLMAILMRICNKHFCANIQHA